LHEAFAASMKLERFIRRKFRRLAFRPGYARAKSLPSFNEAFATSMKLKRFIRRKFRLRSFRSGCA
jgi:hypothetical protein